MAKDTVIAQARFDDKLKAYLFLSPLLPLFFTFVGIPLIPFWFIFGPKWAKRHFDALSCALTEKSLCVKKGVWFRAEKTIPLDKITDLAVTEGPLLRHFGLCSLKIETAGQSSQPGAANADMTGVVDALGFRDRVLAQRDLLEERKIQGAPAAQASAAPSQSSENLLAEIRDSLVRIEGRLESLADRDGGSA